ncbi:MAG: NUDIX hydrolase [Ignavibacteria bacterium]|nr:NUDIX hydrolase [Ignavibacteria bacterium]
MIEFEAINFHRNGTGVVAENSEGKVILVKNYRYINDYYSWEVPAGTIPPDMDHSDCIIEELKEEAGCEVRRDNLRYLGKFLSFDRFQQSDFHC